MIPRRTVRLRLTLLYLTLFLGSAASVLVITYLLVAHQLSQGTSQQYSFSAANSASGTVISGGASSGACGQLSGTNGPASPAAVSTCLTALQHHTTHVALEELLIESGVALGIMAVASVGLGWLMAGRVLSPLRVITTAARRISASNLDERIAMAGPDDELKELGDTFDGLLGRLESSFRAQRQFVANASHELRTPLARQRTVLEVALRDPHASADTLRKTCERALAAGEESERLIAALLTLARSERGLDRFEALDLGELTALVMAGRSGSPRLLTDLSPAPASGSPALAERLIANLLDNAVRYNVPGGRVEVATGIRDGRAFLTIRNTGPVVPPDQLARLFEPFQRLEGQRTRSSSGEGLGLGLAIVAAIASAHHASVTATACEDGGLLIELTFPAVTAPLGSEVLARGHRAPRALVRVELVGWQGAAVASQPALTVDNGERHDDREGHEHDRESDPVRALMRAARVPGALEAEVTDHDDVSDERAADHQHHDRNGPSDSGAEHLVQVEDGERRAADEGEDEADTPPRRTGFSRQRESARQEPEGNHLGDQPPDRGEAERSRAHDTGVAL
jgi:signal transduction histidine kinase